MTYGFITHSQVDRLKKVSQFPISMHAFSNELYRLQGLKILPKLFL